MTEQKTGKIFKKQAPFTMTSNKMITDQNLSTRAKGLYVMIAYYVSIPNFTLYRTVLEKMVPEGERAFRSMWNELKDNGYLKITKKNTPNGFIYEYELLDEPENSTSDETNEENKNTRIVPELNSIKSKTKNQKQDTMDRSREISNNFPNMTKCTCGESTAWIYTSGDCHDINNNELKKNESNKTISNQSIIDETANTTKSYFTDDMSSLIDGWDNTLSVFSENDLNKILIEDDIRNNSNNYTFNDYYDYAYEQVDAEGAAPIILFTDDKTKAKQIISEWINIMAEIYSCEDDYIYIGKSKRRTINAKQMLLKLTPYSFKGVLMQFNEKYRSVNNPASYMKTMLLTAASSNGYSQDFCQERKY